jgi:hypothetical protein
MKKILSCTLLILTFAGSAFAAALTTNEPTTAAGSAVRGGSTQPLATAAPTPLIKCSTGVHALVNFQELAGSPGTSTGYVIATRHINGSKNFATTNAKTNIYWKQASKITSSNLIATAMKAEIAAGFVDTFAFDGTGWTSY